VILVLAVGCGDCSDLEPPTSVGAVRQITAADQLIGGLEAAGRVGDWLIANEHVRFIVQDAGTATGWGLYGGSIVDLAHAGVDPDGDDRLQEIFFQCDLRAFAAETAAVVEEDGRVMLRLSGRDAGIPLIDAVLPSQSLDLETTMDLYLAPGSRTLEIVQTAKDSRKREPRDLDCGPILIQGDSLNLFVEGAGDDRDEFASSLDWLAAAAPDASASFALYRAQGELQILAGALPAMVAQTGREQFLANDSRVERYYLSVGELGDVESALAERRRVLSDETARRTVELRARVPSFLEAHVERAWVVIRDVADPQRPQARTQARFQLDTKLATAALLPGTYRADVSFDGWTVAEVAFAVGAATGAPVTVDVTIGELGELAIESRRTDASGTELGRTAAKVVLLEGHGVARTGPQFLRRYVAPTDRLVVPVGDYTLYASRGPEYDLYVEDITITEGQATSVTAKISHVVDTTGWISADLHVHGAASMDADPARRIRVLGAIAEGLDILVSTDHDITSDYAPTAKALGVDDLITTVSGIEASPLPAHINGYPVPAESPERYWDVAWFEQDDRDNYVRTMQPVEVVQLLRDKGAQVVHLNHPRDTGAFAYLGLDAMTGEFTKGDWPGADAFELMNDTGGSDIPQLLEDWAALIRSGRRITALGVSDAHGEFGVGYSRTFIASDRTDAADLDHRDVWAALRDGKVIAMNGPFVTITGSGGGATASMGETLNTAGPLTLDVKVQAPPWMHVGELRIFENGTEWHREVIAQTTDVVRLETTVTATPAADAWYFAIVDGERRNQPVMSSESRTITNPVYVDTDGDGFRIR